MKTVLTRTLPLVGAAFALCFLASCQTMHERRPPPMTVSQIGEMSKSGIPAQDIIRKIHESDTVYRLRASELARLREQGVPDDVIDYMQETHLESTRREQYFRDWNYGPNGYWYGGYPFGWPYWDAVVLKGGHGKHERHLQCEKDERMRAKHRR